MLGSNFKRIKEELTSDLCGQSYFQNAFLSFPDTSPAFFDMMMEKLINFTTP